MHAFSSTARAERFTGLKTHVYVAGENKRASDVRLSVPARPGFSIPGRLGHVLVRLEAK
jgi:hypothetical protein